MIKADSDRLLKSLAMSIVFHAFMFGGMNLLDWFPETDIPPRLVPVIVKIDKVNSVSSVSPAEEEPLPAEIQEQNVSIQANAEPKIAALSGLVSPSVPVEAKFDPYADLRISDDSVLPFSFPVKDEPFEPKADYIPTEGNVINFEDAEPLGKDEVVSPEAVRDVVNTQVLSGEAIDELEIALAYEGKQQLSGDADSSYQNREFFKWEDSPVKFKSPGVNRYLVSEPLISIPSVLSDMISSEHIVMVEFLLNDEGMLKDLKMKQSSGYSEIDNSIKSELRKWEFDKAPGAADVGGIVTIILKGR